MEKDGVYCYGPLILDVDELTLIARRLSEMGEWHIRRFDERFDSLETFLGAYQVPVGRVHFESETIDITLSQSGGEVRYSPEGAEKAREIDRQLVSCAQPHLVRYRYFYYFLLAITIVVGLRVGHAILVLPCVVFFFYLDYLAAAARKRKSVLRERKNFLLEERGSWSVLGVAIVVGVMLLKLLGVI